MSISDARKLIVVGYRGNTLAQLGRYDDALASYRSAVRGWRRLGLPNQSRTNALFNMAVLYGRRRNWEAAREAFEEQLVLESHLTTDRASSCVLRLGAILAWQNDGNAQAERTRELLARSATQDELTSLERVIKPLLIRPVGEGHPALLEEVYGIAETIGDNAEGEDHAPYFHCLRGIMEYRRADYAEAIRWLRPLQSSSIYHCRLPALYFLAMAEHRMRDFAAAEELFQSAEIQAEALPDRNKGLLGGDWHDELFAFLVQDEARTLIDMRKPNARE